MNQQEAAAKKIIKKLKSQDDNDKLAALAYFTKLFPTPGDFIKSEYSNEIWTSLRSTQFLERCLLADETKQLVFMILSVFSHICPQQDLLPFFSLLKPLIDSEYSNEAATTIIEMAQCVDDVCVLFEYYEIKMENLMFFSAALNGAKGCTLTPAVYRNRDIVFSYLNGNEDLKIRRYLFLIIAYLTKANPLYALHSDASSIDITQFLKAEKFAFIELRLQLDIPVNYLELEENEKLKEKEAKNEPIPKVEFTQKIGDLINPEISAAACELLEVLVTPLVQFDEELNDKLVANYFACINSILEDTIEIFKAADGKRDEERNELKCLLVLFSKWLTEAAFLCDNEKIIKAVSIMMRLLWWFPNESLLYLPLIESWVDSPAKSSMKTGGFNELSQKMLEIADPKEKIMIQKLIQTIFK